MSTLPPPAASTSTLPPPASSWRSGRRTSVAVDDISATRLAHDAALAVLRERDQLESVHVFGALPTQLAAALWVLAVGCACGAAYLAASEQDGSGGGGCTVPARWVGWVLRLSLSAAAALVLVYKRFAEVPQRPAGVWFWDCAKQGAAMLLLEALHAEWLRGAACARSPSNCTPRCSCCASCRSSPR